MYIYTYIYIYIYFRFSLLFIQSMSNLLRCVFNGLFVILSSSRLSRLYIMNR